MTRLRPDVATIHIQHLYKEDAMTQLHCYVPEEIAQQAQRRATQSGLSLSRYVDFQSDGVSPFGRGI